MKRLKIFILHRAVNTNFTITFQWNELIFYKGRQSSSVTNHQILLLQWVKIFLCCAGRMQTEEVI